MIRFLVPILFAILVFLFFGIVLYLTKYKRRGNGCHSCGDTSCACDTSLSGNDFDY
ncbi:MAG: FeoB-associated Cys-rich membrane protein [Candidatus Aminicenantes bacterium]|nr:FeoB-associated Cys-rich membrane protein [Candidatus Aminicenantes bacterium]